MTLMGKIFTMLILVMSVLFLGFSLAVFATHRNWRAEVKGGNGKEGLEEKLRKAKVANDELETRRKQVTSQLAFEQAARRTVIANLQSKLSLLTGQLQQRQGDYNKLTNTHRVVAVEVRQKLNDLDRVTREVEQLRTQILAAHEARDEKFQEIVGVTDRLNEA